MTIGTRRQFQAAIDRARELRGWKRVSELGDGRYGVLGTRGDLYTVVVDADGEFTCTCRAGVAGMPCWHQGSAWMKWIAARAAAPAPAAAIRAPAPAIARAPDAVTGRTSGRGIGISPADLGDDEDPHSLAEILAAHRAA